MKVKIFFQAIFAVLVTVLFTSHTHAAPKIPCSTAKLIVPWKAGGGTHVLFSIYEKKSFWIFFEIL